MTTVLAQFGDLEIHFGAQDLLELFEGVELVLAVLLKGGFAAEGFFGPGHGHGQGHGHGRLAS